MSDVLSALPAAATAEETLRAVLREWARLAGGRGLLGLEELALAEAGLGALGDLVDELNRYAGMLDEREEDEPMHDHTRGWIPGAGGSP